MSATDLKQSLKTTIVQTAIYYGRDLKPEVLGMMAGDLEDLDAQECIDAYQRYRKNPANRTFPLPAQIRELVNPGEFIGPEVKAREIGARFIGAITNFGWNNSRGARYYIGEEGWEAVERQGGWMHLCQNVGVGIQSTTLQAQLRDQIEGTLRYGSSVIDQSIRALPEGGSRGARGLQPVGDLLQILARKISQPGDPDWAA